MFTDFANIICNFNRIETRYVFYSVNSFWSTDRVTGIKMGPVFQSDRQG